MSDISLSKAVRSNLLSLQNTSALMAKTQERLATGNKVNSALDNPTNFFTASALNSRAGDLNQLMDGMANGIQTLQAADNGLKAITKTLESMQSTLRQARQDKSFQTASYTLAEGMDDTNTLSFSGGSIGSTPVEFSLGTAAVDAVDPVVAEDAVASSAEGTVAFANDAALQAQAGAQVTLTSGANTVSFTVGAGSTKDELLDALNANGFSAEFNDDNELVVSRADGADFTIGGTDVDDLGLTAGDVDNGTLAVAGSAGTPEQPATSKSVDQLVQEINNSDDLKGKIRASNDNGKLRIENMSTQELDVGGAASDGTIDGETDGVNSIGGNTVRSGLADQFNELRDQLDKLADDASFNGINLLRGDKLTITFNETGTSSIDIQRKEADALNSGTLGLPTTLTAADLDSDATIDSFLADIKAGLNDVRSQASSFGSNLSIVQNRQDFTKNMINTLQTGGANLTLADMNEEAANLLALQTRQSLSSSSLSLASQADQSVLQLIR